MLVTVVACMLAAQSTVGVNSDDVVPEDSLEKAAPPGSISTLSGRVLREEIPAYAFAIEMLSSSPEFEAASLGDAIRTDKFVIESLRAPLFIVGTIDAVEIGAAYGRENAIFLRILTDLDRSRAQTIGLPLSLVVPLDQASEGPLSADSPSRFIGKTVLVRAYRPENSVEPRPLPLTSPIIVSGDRIRIGHTLFLLSDVVNAIVGAP